MKNGYDQFFKNARKVAGTSAPPSSSIGPGQRQRLNARMSEEELEKQLKNHMGMKQKPKRRRRRFPWKAAASLLIGIAGAAWGVLNYDQLEGYAHRIEISVGEASAQEAAPKAEAKAPAKDAKAAAKAPAAEGAAADATAKNGDGESGDQGAKLTESDIDHLSKLNERKKELDEREEELNRVDQELQAQKTELEKRMKELEDVRRGISSVLEDRVKVDDKKIDTLVQMYSDMKAPQAAKVLETMDEDLAVEVLGRMKKKNAADIMNLLKPEKAQALSEKFAGYKRK